MMRARHVAIFALVAAMAAPVAACGDDDDDGSTGASPGDTTGEAVAPPPDLAFSGVTTALEAQGLAVTQLPNASLDGAQVGIEISGDRSGTARSFPSEAKADAYADEAAKEGDQTTTVGTVVFQAATQDDADFFAAAYEG
jgi:hypothetical protein